MNDDKAQFELREKPEIEECSGASSVQAVTLFHCRLRTVNTGHSA